MVTDPLYVSLADAMIGHQAEEILTGILLPEESLLGTYDYALSQKLAEPYLAAMQLSPQVGESIFFNNL